MNVSKRFLILVFGSIIASSYLVLAQGWGPGDETVVEKKMDGAAQLIGQTVSKLKPADAYAVGIGTDDAQHPAEVKRKARDSAFLDGFAKLGALIDGIYIQGAEKESIAQAKTHSQELFVSVDAVVKGSETALEVWVPDKKLYYVVLKIPSVTETLRKQAGIEIRWAGSANEKKAIKAMGLGYSTDKPFTSLSLIKARESAYIDANRKLLDTVMGVVIKMIAKAEFELKEREIKTFVEGKLKHARTVGENWEGKCGPQSYCVYLLTYEEEVEDALVMAGVAVQRTK